MELNARFSEQPIYTIAAATISGSIELADTRASLPAPLVAELAQIPMAQLEGMVSIDLQSAHLERDSLPQAKGTVRWQQAAVTIADTARLGDINIQLTPDGSAYQQAVINNEGGDIALDGNANIEADGAYNIELDMLAGNNASENVRKSLGMFARPRPGGGYQLKHEGNLNDLAL